MSQSPIRIAFLVDQIATERAGTERQLLELIKRLNPELFEPHLVVLRATEWTRKEHDLIIHNLEYKGLLKKDMLGTIRRLKRLQREKGFDVIHTFFSDSVFVAWLSKAFLSPRPVLLSSRRDMGLAEDEPWYHKLYRLLLPLVNNAYDGIVVNSKILAKWVHRRERVSWDKIKVIPNGIDIPWKKEAKPELFKKEKADVWIGIVANLKPIKRIDVFLEAFRCLKNNCGDMNVKAIILGDGHLKEQLINLARGLNLLSNVFFMGSVSNVVAYLQNVDIGVLSSDREGLSNAILEYMACALPVVATNVGGNSELVGNGINGFLVPPADPGAMGKALHTLVKSSDLRKKMGEASICKVKEKYTWDKVIPLWEQYYMGLVNRDSA